MASIRLNIVDGPLAEVEADLLVVGAFQEGQLEGAASQLDAAMDGLLSRAFSEKSFSGTALSTEWFNPAPVKARRVLLIGQGKAADYDLRILRRVAGVAARKARSKKAARVCIALDAPRNISSLLLSQNIADGALTALFEPDLYKEKRKEARVEELLVWVAEAGDEARAGLERGEKIASSLNFARWLSEEPGNIMTPTRFAEEVQKAAADRHVECEVLDEEAISAAGMGSLLSVTKGSRQPPRVVVLRYNGGGAEGAPLGLVGKGVTFDTGGISIKPALDMHYMKYDMCGAAAVLSATLALADMGAKANVIAVAGLVENMPGGAASRPGDVVRAANGKTIEIINTDAEGRLVLADALDLARKRGADRLVDVATLTGGIKLALGSAATGVMGSPRDWVAQVLAAAERTGERLWELPLYSEYKDQLQSNIADMINSAGRFASALTAGAFLQNFVGDTPWAHLDIAGTAWTEKDSAWQTRGATGVMIRTLVELAETST